MAKVATGLLEGRLLAILRPARGLGVNGTTAGQRRPLSASAAEAGADSGREEEGEELIPAMSFEELFALHNTSLPDLKVRTRDHTHTCA